MTDIVIRVENLGKLYRIGKPERYRTLRDTLTDAISAPFRRLPSLFGNSQSSIRNSQSNSTIWALKDVFSNSWSASRLLARVQRLRVRNPKLEIRNDRHRHPR